MEKLYSQSESREILSPASNEELNLISPLKDKQYIFPSPVASNVEELASPASVRSTDIVGDKTTEQKEATSNQIQVSQQTRVFYYFCLVLLYIKLKRFFYILEIKCLQVSTKEIFCRFEYSLLFLQFFVRIMS